MKCVILAAGMGTRLRGKMELKPLVAVGGMPLIEHVIGRVRRAGVAQFVVVGGHRGEDLRRALDAYASRTGTQIQHAINDEWQRHNGVSLGKAKPFVDGPFLLSMCDHIVDPQLVATLMNAPLPADCVNLAVDRNLLNPLVDAQDVTRVQSADGRITRIGKLIPTYDCYDTGVFLCSSAVFPALEQSQSGGDDSISGAMNVLAAQGRARCVDIGDLPWIDVDDAAAFAQAETLLASGRL